MPSASIEKHLPSLWTNLPSLNVDFFNQNYDFWSHKKIFLKMNDFFHFDWEQVN